MNNPAVVFWDMTNPTTGAISNAFTTIAAFQNTQATDLTSTTWKFAGEAGVGTQAGSWSMAEPLLIEFNTSPDVMSTAPIKLLRFKLYDTSPGVGGANDITSDAPEHFFGVGGQEDWQFKFALASSLIDPADIDPADIESGALLDASNNSTAWTALNYGSSAGNLIDSLITTLIGNDGNTDKLVVRHATQTQRWFLNFFIYVAVKPRSEAAAGTQAAWGFRINYVYPGT